MASSATASDCGRREDNTDDDDAEGVSDIWPLVSSWVEERRALGDRPEDVLSLLGVHLVDRLVGVGGACDGSPDVQPALGGVCERAEWVRAALLAAEFRALCRPRPPLAALCTADHAASLLRSSRHVLVVLGADASASAGFPNFPARRSADTASAMPNTDLFSAVAAAHGLGDAAELFEMERRAVCTAATTPPPRPRRRACRPTPGGDRPLPRAALPCVALVVLAALARTRFVSRPVARPLPPDCLREDRHVEGGLRRSAWGLTRPPTRQGCAPGCREWAMPPSRLWWAMGRCHVRGLAPF
jgi:hypothetical protein